MGWGFIGEVSAAFGPHPQQQLQAPLIDLKNVGHQDDPCVLANRVTLVFYVLSIETGKHVVVS
jgi:hypothetical protein